jgi:nicotinate-nucleotide adenylyltransferase
MKRIGIYSGTFDPVHAGHLSFALQAIKEAKLDVVYFLPERRPHNKAGVEHFSHRVAMLTRATRPYRRLKVLELEDISFTVATTLPRLRKRFRHAQLVLLTGSDVVQYMPQWPNADQLLKQIEIVIGVRAADNLPFIQESIARWPVQPQQVTVFDSFAANVSSRSIREALQKRRYAPGLLRSVERYSDRNWLYVTVA